MKHSFLFVYFIDFFWKGAVGVGIVWFLPGHENLNSPEFLADLSASMQRLAFL